VKSKVLFVIPSLKNGGAEAVCVSLANALTGDFDITIATFENIDAGDYNSIGLNPAVKVVPLINSSQGVLASFFCFNRLMNMVKRGEFLSLLGFMERANLHVRIVSLLTGCKALYSCHASLDAFSRRGVGRNIVINLLYRRILSRNDLVVAVTPALRDNLKSTYSLRNVVSIPNILGSNTQFKDELFRQTNYVPQHLYSIGRLHKVKRVDIAILAVKLMVENGDDVVLKIIGEGDERQQLRQLIRAKNASSYVELCGFIADPFDSVCSGILLLTSETESFGLVIAEALISGMRVIATDTEGSRFFKELLMESGFNESLTVVSADGDKLHFTFSNAIKKVLGTSYSKTTAKKVSALLQIQLNSVAISSKYKDLLEFKK